MTPVFWVMTNHLFGVRRRLQVLIKGQGTWEVGNLFNSRGQNLLYHDDKFKSPKWVRTRLANQLLSILPPECFFVFILPCWYSRNMLSVCLPFVYLVGICFTRKSCDFSEWGTRGSLWSLLRMYFRWWKWVKVHQSTSLPSTWILWLAGGKCSLEERTILKIFSSLLPLEDPFPSGAPTSWTPQKPNNPKERNCKEHLWPPHTPENPQDKPLPCHSAGLDNRLPFMLKTAGRVEGSRKKLVGLVLVLVLTNGMERRGDPWNFMCGSIFPFFRGRHEEWNWGTPPNPIRFKVEGDVYIIGLSVCPGSGLEPACAPTSRAATHWGLASGWFGARWFGVFREPSNMGKPFIRNVHVAADPNVG